MYAAIRQRDGSVAGLFFVAVTTTGIFCRPGCPARTPNREHCEFFASAASAMQAGYRACKRCRPLLSTQTVPAWASELARMLEADPARELSADDARRAGAHPATAARYFKKHMGSTFQALSRASRIGMALVWLREGKSTASAAARAGFESESGFRKAVADLFGATPQAAAEGNLRPLVARWINTPLGPMIAAASDSGICLLEFLDRRMLATNLRMLRRRTGRPIAPGPSPLLDTLEQQLAEFFQARRDRFEVPLHVAGTPFQELVWNELCRIPAGQTRSYAQLAAGIGRPTAVRAVARANGDNRIAILIPCHRVIGSDGTLVGYGGGLDRKRRLLEIESRWGSDRRGPSLFAPRGG